MRKSKEEERSRVAVLRAYGILDTPREPEFDRIAHLAAGICGTPIALISLVDGDRIWFKSTHGFAWRDGDLATSFCVHAIDQREVFVVGDTALDARFAANPMVIGDAAEAGLRFYAGVPLLTPDGIALGSLAVIDRVPRVLDALQHEALRTLAAQVMTLIESRHRQRGLQDALAQKDAVHAELVDGEARWRLLFEHNPLPMWVYDQTTLRFLAVNDATVATYGWTREEFLAMTIAAIRPAEDQAALQADLALRRTGLHAPQLWRHSLRSGRVIHVEITAHSIPFADRPARLVLAHDVTERVLAETALRDSEARWRQLFEASATGITSCAADGSFLSANPAFCALTGRSEAELLALHFLDITHPDDRISCADGLARLQRGEVETVGFEKRYVRPDGSAVWARAAVALTTPGRLEGAQLVAVVHDIGAQRAADARLREQAALLDAAQDAIIVRDLEGRITYWNRSAQRIFGWTAEEAIGAKAGDSLQEDPLIIAAVRSELTEHGRWTQTITQRRKDGSRVTVDCRWNVLFDSTGAPNAVLAIKTDVTRRVELETQLQQASRLEAVGQLTGGIAHDFNNLLTVILGNADLLAEQLADQPLLRPLAEMTRTAAERGAELTQRLLAFARRQPLQPQAVDPHQLLASMSALLRRTLTENIELEVVRGAGQWPALVDPVQLESAVLNLVLNARDAMPQGGKITLETLNASIDLDYAERHVDVLPGQYVMMSVSDTGTGMTPAQLARAFEPFYTTKGAGLGSGLGLSMVYGLVKQSRGHVKLYSEPGHGTTVRLYLPRADHAAELPAAPRRNEQNLRGDALVLVVEDDELVRRHAADLLGGLGYRVLTAESGPAALAILRARDDIELLFTDVVMPGGINGRQLADAALALHPALKVLYTSGYTENAIVHHGRLDRGVQLLSKPYRAIDLARKVRAVLGLSPAS